MKENTGRRGLFTLVVIGLALQVMVASVGFAGPRPGRYGWQMYSGVPSVPRVWAVSNGHEQQVDLRDLLVHPRAEIDLAAVVRSQGCVIIDAEAIRVELDDDRVETITCPRS